MLQTMITPRYPRRYIGRHRARLVIRFVFSTPRKAPMSASPQAPMN
jgi:hypothetical protein